MYPHSMHIQRVKHVGMSIIKRPTGMSEIGCLNATLPGRAGSNLIVHITGQSRGWADGECQENVDGNQN